jgi:hypothetical protein
MKNKKPPGNEDKNDSESDTQEMDTLFSSDDTELTDFTLRVKQAIQGERANREDNNAGGDQNQNHSTKQENKVSSFRNNVVNLFKPK